MSAWLMVSLGSVLEQLGRERAGWLLLVGAFTLGGMVTGGVYWANDQFSETGRYGERISQLEAWRQIHTDSVAGPGLARLDVVERRILRLEERFGAQLDTISSRTYQLWCDRFPDRCQLRPVREEE